MSANSVLFDPGQAELAVDAALARYQAHDSYRRATEPLVLLRAMTLNAARQQLRDTRLGQLGERGQN